MGDYERKKVIRLPFPKSILKYCGTDDPYDCEDYLKQKLGSLYSYNGKTKGFTIEETEKSSYIDWIIYSNLGREYGDFGNIRYLTEKEFKIIKPYFDKIGCDYTIKDLRLVEYCYYDFSPCKDYYEITELEKEVIV